MVVEPTSATALPHFHLCQKIDTAEDLSEIGCSPPNQDNILTPNPGHEHKAE